MTEPTLTAIDYYKSNPAIKLATQDEQSPHDFDPAKQPRNTGHFFFGHQPSMLDNVDRLAGKKIGLIGAGDVYKKFILPTLAQRGTELYISGSSRTAAAVAEAEAVGLKAHAVNNIADFPEDLDYILMLTPPAKHADNTRDALPKGVPLVIEKPLTASPADADAIKEMIEANPRPVFCIDWAVMHVLPLLKAIGQEAPFTDVVTGVGLEKFKTNFDFKNLKNIEIRFIESPDGFDSVEETENNRAWLKSYKEGGGMLYDMAVHWHNVLATMGLHTHSIQDVQLGKTIPGELGTYEVFGSNGGDVGEIYVRTKTNMRFDGSESDIPTTIEVGKGGAENDGYFKLTDINGNVIQLRMLPRDNVTNKVIPGSQLTLSNAQGTTLARAGMDTDCYALIFEEIDRFLAEQRESGQNTALYFPEHHRVIHTIGQLHEHARSEERTGTISQMLLEDREKDDTPAQRRVGNGGPGGGIRFGM